ncbi:hypothetical protein D3C78_1215190 [compost metagenome]
MRNQPVEVIRRRARRLKGLFDHVGDHADGVLEHFPAFHAQMTNGTCRGRSAIDIELFLVRTVGTQLRGQNAAIGGGTLAFAGFKNQRAGAIAEENAGGAVLPVENAREGFGTDHQDALGHAAANIEVGGRYGINEAGTDGLHVEGEAVGHAKTVLDVHRRCRKSVIRGRGGQNDEVDIIRCQAGIVERGTRSSFAEGRGGFTFAGDIALLDARALHDPFV